MWRRTVKGKQIIVEVAPLHPLSANEKSELAAALKRFEEYTGLQEELAAIQYKKEGYLRKHSLA
jgi:hypothetical protein